VRAAVTLEQCWHRVPGGTAVAALELVAAIERRGDVEVVGVSAAHRRPPAEEWRPGVPVRSIPAPRPALYEAWLRLRRPRVEAATGRVDVIHATTIVIPPRSAPLVVTVHDLAFLHQPDHFTARGLRTFRRGLELLRRDADLVLCSSTATLDDVAGQGIGRDRLRLVPLGVRIEPASSTDVTTARHRYGLDRPYVLFAGTLEPRKNLPRLVAAFDLLSQERGDLDLVLAGPAGWGDVAVGSVRALGFVPAADLRALQAGAAVFAYPSLREGFGLPVLEAMAQGTPVVTSRGTSTEEVAAGHAVLVDPGDVADIARGLDEALHRGGELVEAGRAHAATMTWDRTAELTVAAYRDVVCGSAR
jgi:glycosyltransferase involved in cell wall biosynthesis